MDDFLFMIKRERHYFV